MQRTKPEPDAPTTELILFALRRATAKVAQDFQEMQGEDAIRPSAFAVLSLLRQRPGIRQSQLSPLLGIRRTNLVPLLAELTARGLCERQAVPGDRRAAALYLTAAGVRTLDSAAAACRAHEAKLAARLGPGGREQLLSLLHRLPGPAAAEAPD